MGGCEHKVRGNAKNNKNVFMIFGLPVWRKMNAAQNRAKTLKARDCCGIASTDHGLARITFA
jgi:hypothetical protein